MESQKPELCLQFRMSMEAWHYDGQYTTENLLAVTSL